MPASPLTDTPAAGQNQCIHIGTEDQSSSPADSCQGIPGTPVCACWLQQGSCHGVCFCGMLTMATELCTAVNPSYVVTQVLQAYE